MRFEDVHSLLEPEALPYLSGVERLDDGILHVAALTRMPGVTPRMFEWWFGEYMQTSEHYRRWHPRDHVWMDWADKQPGTHIGAKHLVHEYIGGRFSKLRIHFLPPDQYFGAGFVSDASRVAICARAGLLERPIEQGRMVHLAIRRDWGCELHSRFWLGYLAARSGSGRLLALANRSWVRRLALSMTLGRGLALHCHEEMTTLGSFLPELYAAECLSTADSAPDSPVGSAVDSAPDARRRVEVEQGA